MADKDFVVKNGIVVSGNVTLSNTSAIIANNSPGSNGQVLTSNGSAAYWSTSTGGGGSGNYTANTTAPSSPNAGDEWLDTDTGILYTYVNDGSSSQWVELGPYNIVTPINFNLDGGAPDSSYGGLSLIDAGGTT